MGNYGTKVDARIGVKAEPETYDQHGNALVLTPGSKIDLRDAHAIRRELGAVYRDMRAGTIETQHGTRLAYVLDMIRKAYEIAVLQERLELIQRTLDQRKDRP
jgi:hypothetical protein